MMKKIFLIFSIFLYQLSCAQKENINSKVTIKWAPTGLLLGNVALQGEYNFTNKNSLTAKISIPINIHRTFQYEDKDATFNMKAVSFLAGYRTYLSQKDRRGFYFEPYFKYVRHTSDGIGNGTIDNKPVIMGFTNTYKGAGIGAQLGTQFMVGKRLVIDFFFLGPELNLASNHFRAVETTSSISWNSVEATDAEHDIREFIGKFPFIRNRTKIMVDKENRSVTADFKGALPGFRTGIALGIAL